MSPLVSFFCENHLFYSKSIFSGIMACRFCCIPYWIWPYFQMLGLCSYCNFRYSEIKIFRNFPCLFPKLWFFFNVRCFELFKYLVFAFGLALVLADCFSLMNSPSAHTSAILSAFCGAWLLRNDLDPFFFYQTGKKLSSSLKLRFGMQKIS